MVTLLDNPQNCIGLLESVYAHKEQFTLFSCNYQKMKGRSKLFLIFACIFLYSKTLVHVKKLGLLPTILTAISTQALWEPFMHITAIIYFHKLKRQRQQEARISASKRSPRTCKNSKKKDKMTLMMMIYSHTYTKRNNSNKLLILLSVQPVQRKFSISALLTLLW